MHFLKKSLLSSLSFFIYISKLYGCFSFSSKNKFDSISFKISAVGIFHGLIFISICSIYRLILNFSRNLEMVQYLSASVCSLTAVVSFIGYVCHAKNLQKNYEKIFQYSTHLKNDDFYKKVKYFTVFEIILTEFTCVAYYVIFYFSRRKSFHVLEMCFEYYLRYIITLLRLQFTNSLLLLFSIIKSINEEFFEMCIPKGMLSNLKLKKPDTGSDTVSNRTFLYTRAFDSWEELNICFGPTLASASVNVMIQIVLGSFLMFNNRITVPMFLFWFLSFFVEEWFVLFACEKIMREVQRTGVLIHNLIAQTRDPRLKEQLELFSNQLLFRKVEFTACGLFPLNYTLIYSVAGACTTYIVILIQFQISAEDDD